LANRTILPYRFVQYVCAVGKHFYLVGAATLLTLAPFVELILPSRFQPFYLTHIKPGVGWSHWTALICFFVATFLAWNSERDAREEAERSTPEALKQDLEAVQRTVRNLELTQRQQSALTWQPLTEKQKNPT
jgi:hypothetical protein